MLVDGKMRAKPISVRFPIPKVAAAKLRDLAISRDPRLLELGVLAVQITEHEKIVVSFGKPPYGKTKQRQKNKETPKAKKTRVKTVRRNRPKSTNSVTCPVSAASIAFPGITNRWQERHLNNKKLITDKSNSKVARQTPKGQLHQTVGRHRNIKSTSVTQRDSTMSAVNSFTTAKSANIISRNNTVSSKLSYKQTTTLNGLDNKNHVFQNAEGRRSRVDLGPVEGAIASPSPCPSDASSLSLSSASPLVGEDRNRSCSSSSSSQNEQTCFSLTGIQEASYMGRQRAMFDWFMNSNEKKFSASNKLRELAKGHSTDGKKKLPESSSLRKSATPSSTNLSYTESTMLISSTRSLGSNPIATPPCVSTSTNTRLIPTPTPGIHCVKMSKRSLSGLGSMPHFSVKESLSGNQTDMSVRSSSNNKSIDENSVSLVENLRYKYKKDFITNSSKTGKCWTSSSEVITNVAANNTSVNSAGETYNTEKNSINNTFAGLTCLANEVTTSKVQCETSANTKIETGFGNPEVMNTEPHTSLPTSVKPHGNNAISIDTSQFLGVQTVDTNNNQVVSKSPLMYPYSTSLLSSPVTVASKVTAIPGVLLGLQYASVKPQVSAIQQMCIPSQLATEINAKPKSGSDLETAFSSAIKADAKQIDAEHLAVPPHSKAKTFQELINNQLCHKGLNTNVSTLPSTESSRTMTNISNSQLSFTATTTSAPAFVTTPSVFINPHPASNLQASSNPPALTSSPYANQQTTLTPTSSVTSLPISASQTSNTSYTKTTNVQKSELFLVAKENLQQQSGRQLDDVMQKVKTEDYSQSIQGLGEVLHDGANKATDSQLVATAPIQFIDLSGTWRYWQQWSLYYRSLIEKQNAVAALLSMQNSVPPSTSVTTGMDLQLNRHRTTKADTRLSSSLTSSLDKEENVIKVSKGDDFERQVKVWQDETDTKLSSDPVFIAAKFNQGSKLQEMVCDKVEHVAANAHSESKEKKGYPNTEISSQNSNNDFLYNRESSTEAKLSSFRKSVIVETRTNELGFPVFDESEMNNCQIDANSVSCETFESNNAKMENSTVSVGEKCKEESSNNISEIENSDRDSTTQEFVNTKENFTEMLKAEQVIDLNLTSSLATLDNDGEIGLMSFPRILQRRRSNSNPPELSFIPESAIECVNVGSSKRGKVS